MATILGSTDLEGQLAEREGKREGRQKGGGTAVGEPQGARGGKKVARNTDWGGELEGRKALRHTVLRKSAGLFLV